MGKHTCLKMELLQICNDKQSFNIDAGKKILGK